MISKEEFIVIHTLYKKGYSMRAISRELGIDRRTVKKRLLEKDLMPYKKPIYKSKLDDFKEQIDKRIKEADKDFIPSTVIYEEIKSKGYKGSLRTLQTYLSKIRKQTTKDKKILRFETKPGYQAQVDWTVIRGGKSPIYGYVMILGYSRMAFVYFTDNMSQESWQDCHVKAFEHFGGVPQTILYDNLKSVVIQRDKYGKNNHGFNDSFLEFSKNNFIPKLCLPYRAKTKGKVERFNRYLKENFYTPLKTALRGSNIEITVELLNQRIFSWLEYANSRVHDTTKQKPNEMFKEESKYLSPFYKSIKEEKVKEPVSKDRYINIEDIDIDITYHTTISDYEMMIGGRYVNA